MELVFLGTSSMVPTTERNHNSILLRYGRENLLVDCGEGTQRQLKKAGIAAPKITRILISHWHGDHVLGLPGLLQTLAASGVDHAIHLYGPRGTKAHYAHMLRAFFFEERLDVEVHDIVSGVFLDTPEFSVEAAPLNHSVPCIGYRFVEKPKRRMRLDVVKKLGIPDGPLLGKLQDGKTVVHQGKTVTAEAATQSVPGRAVAFLFDTALCKSCVALAKDADLLIAESTYANELEEKAADYKHLTAGQAASIASQAGAKKLVLTHFSQRYKDVSDILEQAQTVFPETVAAKDFMKLRL